MKSLREELGREMTPSEEKRREEIISDIARRMDARLEEAIRGAATRGVRGSIAGQYSIIIRGDRSEEELAVDRERRQREIVQDVEEWAEPAG